VTSQAVVVEKSPKFVQPFSLSDDFSSGNSNVFFSPLGQLLSDGKLFFSDRYMGIRIKLECAIAVQDSRERPKKILDRSAEYRWQLAIFFVRPLSHL